MTSSRIKLTYSKSLTGQGSVAGPTEEEEVLSCLTELPSLLECWCHVKDAGFGFFKQWKDRYAMLKSDLLVLSPVHEGDNKGTSIISLLGAAVTTRSTKFSTLKAPGFSTLKIKPQKGISFYLALPNTHYTSWLNQCKQIAALPELSIDQFVVGEQIGRGTFGKVFEAADRLTGKPLALKVMRRRVDAERSHGVKAPKLVNLVAERVALEEIGWHPHLVALRHAWQDLDFTYFTTDLLPGGEVYKVAKKMPSRRFDIDTVRTWSAQLVSALTHLHGKGLVHRDIKPENLLLDEHNHIKLTDFGLTFRCETEADKQRLACGTPEYMAPEVLQRIPYSFSVDVWALGVLVYELLLGKTPFYHPDRNVHSHNICLCNPVFPSGMNRDVKDLITRCLDKKPVTRLTLDEVRRHKFFDGLDWHDVDTGRLPVVNYGLGLPMSAATKLDVNDCSFQHNFLMSRPYELQAVPMLAMHYWDRTHIPAQYRVHRSLSRTDTISVGPKSTCNSRRTSRSTTGDGLNPIRTALSCPPSHSSGIVSVTHLAYTKPLFTNVQPSV